MILMIDNYDSFTYNLVQYFGELGQEVEVFRNDKITIQEAEALNPKYLVISPGPCSPKEAGISIDLIKNFKEITGCPVLVNTSFNIRGEPIVCSVKDAFRCFMGTQLDILAIGNYLLIKEEQNSDLELNYKDRYELD